MDYFEKAPVEIEGLIKKGVMVALRSALRSLYNNDIITPERLEDAAGNHLFDDHFGLFGITENEGHQIRSYFQHYSCRRSEEFKKYIQKLIDEA